MNNNVSILRVPPAPIGSLMSVFYAGTQDEIEIYSDRKLTKLIPQPVIMTTTNIQFYCLENTRVDIKIESDVYSYGFILIKDQLMINQDTYFDRIMTFSDTSLVVDSDGNLMTTEL